MFPKKLLFIILIFSVLLLSFSNKIFALPNSTTIEIYQDLSKPLINSSPNSLLIENNEVIILNNNLKRLKLFNLSDSDGDVFITLVSGSNKLLVYKNGKKVNLISLNDINLSSLIANLQNSFNDGEITNLQISGFALSPKRVLKNYLDLPENDIDKHLKEKIVTGDNLKLYYSGSNIDNKGNSADPTDMISTWADLSGNKNNATLTNFTLAPSPTTSSGQVVTSGWDGNNVYSNPSKLTFDGVNDYVQPGDSSPFNFTATTPFTIEFWAYIHKSEDPFQTKSILSKINSYTLPGYQVLLQGTNLWVHLGQIFGGNQLFGDGIWTFLTAPLNRWVHIVITYNGSSQANGLQIYFNGGSQTYRKAQDNLPNTAQFNNGIFRLGASGLGNSSFKGSLGDVRIYNKALSQAEALQNYQSEQSKYFQAPKIVTLSPAKRFTTNVQTDLAITFDQSISKGTGNIRIIKANTTTTVETIEVTSDRVTISDKTATINPVNNLLADTTYYIEIDQNAFQSNGISFPGISDTLTWNFLTEKDSTRPIITALNPENGSQTVPVASDLVVTFDKTVYPGSGGINIFNIDDDPAVFVETISVQSTFVTGAGTNMITINPSNFSSNSSYLVAFDSPAFQNSAGTNYKPIDEWIFLTVDTTPISVTSFSPSNDATNVSANTNLQINFNKPVTANAGNITIKKASDNSLVETISVNSEAVTVSGTNTATIITINPTTDLASDTEYYVNVDANTFNDTAGNNFTGIADKFTWNFKTADIAAPVINNLSPSNRATKVNVNSDLIVVFNEPVQTNTGNITITKLTRDVIPPVETINVTGNLVKGSGTNTIAINPAMDLEEDVRYFINIDSTAFTDLSGNAFSGISTRGTWSFTTVDVTAPTITNLSPSDNATKINANSNLVITFNEIAYPQAGGKKINIFKSANNKTPIESIDVTNNAVTGIGSNIITINPSIDFSENTDYFITIAQGAFADFSGNTFAGIVNNTTWNFKTADITEPAIVGLFPLKNAVDVNIGTNLIITFSEPVTANAGNITIKNTAGDLVLETVDVTSNAITGKGTNIIAVALPVNFANGTNYYVNIDPGTFVDLEGNGFIGITDNNTWNFKTVVPKNIEGGNIGGSEISGCLFTKCGQLCCINGCCPKNQGTCIDFADCLTSSSGSSNISSSSSGGFSPFSSSSSSSGGFIFPFPFDEELEEDPSSLLISPITITGPEIIKPGKKKIALTISHPNVENEIKCSVIPIGLVKILTNPENFSFTPGADTVDVKLKINKKAFKKVKKDSSKKIVQIKVLCDDGEKTLNIELAPK